MCPEVDRSYCCFFFFFNDTATTEIYTLSLHDALPISAAQPARPRRRMHAGVRELHHRLHLPVRDRRQSARLPAPADLAAVAGRLQLAAGVRGGADPPRVRRRGGGRHCRPWPAHPRRGLLTCERSERATSATRPSSAS